MTDLALERTDCLLCGGRNVSPVVEAPGPGAPEGPRFRVVRCESCGLCFTNPRPAEGDIGRFYPPEYRPHQLRRESAAHRLVPGWWSRWSARLRRRCPDRRWLEPHGRMRLLDVGCGGGSFLARMRAQGWDVTGLDVSEAAVRLVRDELHLSALHGTLPHPELGAQSFDVVTMWQTLEHVHRPLETLRHARELLVPGGRLIVSVPNIDGAPFRWFGTAWIGLELPRHLVHFSPTTLGEMLRRAGFEPQAGRMVRHSSWLQRSARLARRQGLGGPWSLGLLRFRAACHAAGWYCLARGQCDCITATAVKPEDTTE